MSSSSAGSACSANGSALECDMLRLRCVGSRQVLHHIGTGESVKLDGQWYLLRDEKGNGILAPLKVTGSPPPTASPMWASKLLKLHLAETENGDRKGLAIMEGQRLIGWQDELKRGGRTSMTFGNRRKVSDNLFMSERIVCRFPPRDSCSTVWWNPSYALQLLLGKPKYNSWVSRKAERFESLLAELGKGPASCMRKSWRSVAAKERIANTKGTPSPPSKFDDDMTESSFVLTTSALVAVVASIAARPKLWRASQPETVSSTALWIIDSIMAAAFDIDWKECRICEAPATSFKVSRAADGQVDCCELLCTNGHMHDWVAKRILGGSRASIGQVILNVALGLRLQCRASASKKMVLLRCFDQLMSFVEASVELSTDRPVWSKEFLRLPDLFGPQGLRRKLAFATKAAISTEVSESPSLRSNAQVVAGAEIGKRERQLSRGEKKKSQNRSKNASKFTKDVMMGYLHAMRERARDHKHANVQLDGSTFSGMDLEMYAFWNPNRAEGCWLPPMELRHNRIRVGMPGSKFSQREATSFRTRTLEFFRKRKVQQGDEPASAEQQQRAKKRQQTIPKLATSDWLFALHSTLDLGLPHGGLKPFLPEQRAWNDDETEQCKVEDTPLLTIGSDQESKQRTGAYYMLHRGFSLVLLQPIHHRRNNDLKLAFEVSGFSALLRRCMIKANVAYGPFFTGLFMSDLRDASVDISENMSAQHPLIVALWPRIVRDKNLVLPEEIEERGRRKLISELPCSPAAATKGIKCSYNKWMSILDAVEFGDKHNGEKLLMLLYLGIQKGWIDSYEDLWDEVRCPAIVKEMTKAFAYLLPAPKAKAKRGQPAGAGAQPASSSSSSTAPSRPPQGSAPAAGGNDGGDGTIGPNSELKNIRKDTVNTVHVVLKLLANPDEEMKSRLALLVADPARRAHKDDIHSVRSVVQVRAYFAKMASWGFMDELKGVIQTFSKLGDMARLGMVTDFPPSLGKTPLDDPRVQYDDSVANMMWRLARSILKQRSLSSLWYVSSCPGMFGGFLVEGNEQLLQENMLRFKEHWEAYAYCKGSHLPRLQSAANRHPCNNRAVQDFARLCRSSNWQVNDRIKARARLIFDGVGQENFLENCMKSLREVEVKQGTSKQMRTFRYWEAARQSNLFAGNERLEIQPDGQHHPVPASLLDNIFQPRPSSCGELQLANVMKATFYSPSTMSERESWIEVELVRYLHKKEEMNAMSDAWISGLIPEGEIVSILQENGEHSVFYTLAVTRYGVLGWVAMRVGTRYIRLDADATKLQFRFAFDHKKVHVLPTQIRSPFHAFLSKDVPSKNLGCMLELVGSPKLLLEWQTQNAFRGIREDLLRSLSLLLECPVDMVTGNDDQHDGDPSMAMALSLMRSCDPSLTQAEATKRMNDALVLDTEENGHVENCTINSDCYDDTVLEDCLEKNDRAEMKKIKKVEVQTFETIKAKRRTLQRVLKASFDKRPAGPKPKQTDIKKVTSAEMDRWWNTTKGDDRFIVKYLPSSASHYTDNVNGRFLLMQHSLGYDRKSFSWTKRGNQLASLMLLRTAWARHIAALGGECPLPEVLFENQAF